MTKILMVLGGGIGNLVQATPAIRAILNHGHTVDLCLQCNSSSDVVDIMKLEGVRNVFLGMPTDLYDIQLNGLFTFPFNRAKKTIFSRINYAQHTPEVEVYFDLLKQIGIDVKVGNTEISKNLKGPSPKFSQTISIYPGSKPDWAMKRWDKFDLLASKFEHVAIVGTKADFESHGNPAWITKSWNWPKNTEFITAKLKEVAHYISKCKAFIGNDGGLSHVAAATGVPTFIIFGPSSDEKNRPYHTNAHVISHNIPCRPCQFRKDKFGKDIFTSGKANCHHNMKCLRDLEVESVLKQMENKGVVIN